MESAVMLVSTVAILAEESQQASPKYYQESLNPVKKLHSSCTLESEPEPHEPETNGNTAAQSQRQRQMFPVLDSKQTGKVQHSTSTQSTNPHPLSTTSPSQAAAIAVNASSFEASKFASSEGDNWATLDIEHRMPSGNKLVHVYATLPITSKQPNPPQRNLRMPFLRAQSGRPRWTAAAVSLLVTPPSSQRNCLLFMCILKYSLSTLASPKQEGVLDSN
jgi:hypothetical protein